MGQIDLGYANALVAAALKLGADPADWRVSYEDVPLSRVLAVEAWDGRDVSQWVKVGHGSDGELQLHMAFIEMLERVWKNQSLHD